MSLAVTCVRTVDRDLTPSTATLSLTAVRSARISGGWGIHPYCGCEPHVIHGVKVSAFRCLVIIPPLLFS